MLSGSSFSLVDEMLEAPGVLRRFDRNAVAGWAKAIASKGRLMFTGEGSSRIFPAKNAIDLAMRSGTTLRICTEGARQAAEYDLKEFIVVATSNSGRTRELIGLFEKLAAEKVPRLGLTATEGSRLTELVDDCRVLSCGVEKAVASSKTVIEQALFCQSLLGGDEWKNQARAAGYGEDVLGMTVAPEITGFIQSAPIVYFSGRNNGVAEELTLKTNEIARKKSAYLEGTYVLHGIEEVMRQGEALVLIEPFREEIEKYKTLLKEGAGINVVAIASFDTPFPTIKIPALDGFNGYLQLMAGWNVLVAAGIAAGVNLDKPERARKVGNAV
ncbi:MAG: SIS domain-containing protein [Alphaproteobacteria bacterium]